jgi:hypothetical protein
MTMNCREQTPSRKRPCCLRAGLGLECPASITILNFCKLPKEVNQASMQDQRDQSDTNWSSSLRSYFVCQQERHIERYGRSQLQLW